MKIWRISASALLRGVSAAALAGAVVLGLSLPAQASLIDDEITLEVTVCVAFNLGNCTDTVTVVDPAAEFTANPNNPATDIGTNLFLTQGTASFININDDSVDFFFDFGFVSQFIFTGLEWQDEAGAIGTPTFNVTTGNLSSDPSFTNVTDSTFTVSVDCGFNPLCSFATTGVGFPVFLNPTHGENGDGIPEPSALLLLGVGLAGAGWVLRRRRQTV